MFFRSDFMAVTYAFSFVSENFGIAIAAKMPMMTTTIRSSIRVKPLRVRVVMDSFSNGGFVHWVRESVSGASHGREATFELVSRWNVNSL